MNFIFETLNKIRSNAWDSVKGYSEEEMGLIPEGFNNNIAWNLGHMVASQQLLCYRNGGAEPLLPDSFLALYRKGTSPRDWIKAADLKEIKHYFEITSEAFGKDYERKIFTGLSPYTTSAGVTLTSIDEAVLYNYGHENLHYGVILSLRKLVR